MINVALGPKSVFRSISSTTRLKELFEHFAPSAEIDWKKKPRELPDILVDACKALREKSRTEYNDIVCALQEICDVCADRKSSSRLVEAIKETHLLSKFLECASRSESHTIQADAVWIMLNAPKIWERLLVTANAIKIKAKSVEEYRVVTPKQPNDKNVPQLEKAIAVYLKGETLHGENVHVEVDEEKMRYRYLVSINSFPINVQQFDKSGKYEIARDANAVNFSFCYDQHKGTLQIRCPLDVKKRRELVRIFADVILGSQVTEVGKPLLDLASHLERRILPPPEDTMIDSVRFNGMTVAYQNQAGTTDAITLSTGGPTNIQRNMSSILEALKIAVSTVRVTEALYEITLRARGGTKKIRARITPDGFHFICRDAKEREVITSYLNKVTE